MAARNPRAGGRDMVWSMLVLLVPIALIVWFFQTAPEEQVEPVDVGPHLARAQAESPYPVLHPVDAPEDWVPVRVAWAADGERWIDGEPAVGNAWQVGYMMPDGIYVGLQQRDRATDAFVNRITRQGKRSDGVLQVGQREWEFWVSEDRRTNSLVWRDGEMVALVTADAELEVLQAFAGTLQD